MYIFYIHMHVSMFYAIWNYLYYELPLYCSHAASCAYFVTLTIIDTICMPMPGKVHEDVM
jgi:hypothetical protein